MGDLMIFEGHEVEVFELNGTVLFNPYHVGACLELSDSAVRMAVGTMNEKQVVKVKNWGCRLIPIFSPDNKRMRQSAELLAFSGLWFSAGLSHSLFVSNFRT